MKKLVAVTAVLASLALSAGTAPAFQCPTLIKQGRDAAAQMDANAPRVKNVLAKLAKAEALHKDGKHGDSVKEANEALGMLGVQKN